MASAHEYTTSVGLYFYLNYFLWKLYSRCIGEKTIKKRIFLQLCIEF